MDIYKMAFENRYFTKKVTFKAAPSGSGSGGGGGSIVADSGRANARNGVLEIKGATGLKTEASGNIIYIEERKDGWFTNFEVDVDRKTVMSDSGSIKIHGDYGVSTKVSGDTMTVFLVPRFSIITATDLVTLPLENKIYMSNTPAQEGMAVQLPQPTKMGQEMSFLSINSQYPGFEIFPQAGGRIRVGERITSVGNPDGTIGIAKLRADLPGSFLKLVYFGGSERLWVALKYTEALKLY